MPITEIEPPNVIARRVFDALCERFPDKYIALVQPRSVADDRPLSDRIALSPAAINLNQCRDLNKRDRWNCRT